MERYVWELTLNLCQLGHQVTVICERCHTNIPNGIKVVELGEVAKRPGWVAALRFANRVALWLRRNPQLNAIVHSHERIYSHHITTFHSSVFASVVEKPWWHLISMRIAIRLYIERLELKSAKVITPNSFSIKKELARYYPKYASKLSNPVTPGVDFFKVRDFYTPPTDGGIIGFVGIEWKRKGLPLAIEIVKRLKLTRPNLTFVVVGPEKGTIQYLFSDWLTGYVLKEWEGQVDYSQFDVLLHPAKVEAYGMVISETMSACVPVVVSDVCGACVDVSTSSGTVLSLSSPIEAWVNALEYQLVRKDSVPQFNRSWLDVAKNYEQIYQTMQ